jgi:hypothetical protein
MLDTLANVKAYLGVTASGDDAVWNMALSEADAMIKSYLGYGFEESTITDEYHSCDGETDVFTVDYPIISTSGVVVVKYDGTTIDPTEYDVIYGSGIIAIKYCPTQSVKKLSFSYTGGYATIPADVLMVFRGLCNDLFTKRNQRSDIASEKLGDYSYVLKGGNSQSEVQIDPLQSYFATLNKYRKYAF